MKDQYNDETLKIIILIVQDRLPSLLIEKFYTLREIVSPEAWDLMPTGEQIRVGRLFLAYVKKGNINLEFFDKSSSNVSLYRKKT